MEFYNLSDIPVITDESQEDPLVTKHDILLWYDGDRNTFSMLLPFPMVGAPDNMILVDTDITELQQDFNITILNLN
jgi:hypothetical protein